MIQDAIHKARYWSVLGFLACSTLVWAAPDPLLDRLNQTARDINASQKVVGSAEKGQQGAAFAKEAASGEDLKRAVSGVSSLEDARGALATFQKFGYRVSGDADMKAFRQGMSTLESRIKFLSQTEGKQFADLLPSIATINAEVDRTGARRSSPVGGSVNKMVASRGTTSRASEAGDRLGFQVKAGKTSFSVYSPNATDINLVLFTKADDKTGTGYPMKKDNDGVWRCTIDGEMWGKFYGFSADGPTTDGNLFDSRRLLSDPCALANVDHDGKSIVVKTDFTWSDQGFKTPAAKDLVIYETHVKDLTAHSSSGVSAANKGKYLGLLEGNVLGHLKDLGINAVELLPCQEFDNNFAGHMNFWGYMTSHFFAPECGYASGKNGEAVKEFKQMVNGFHKAGIAVIMDVVYNHTAEGNEKGVPLNFKGLDNPGYYRLTPDKKFYMNGTGCGNEFRSDNPMTRKYILDSLKYWMRDYHVDGFRFDLGTIIDKETMTAIINGLPENTILVGEPWAADWQRNQWGKSDFRNTKFGKWNDDFREKIRGFMRGQGERNDVMTVLAGSCFWWAAKPTESVNFLECHDGATMGDMFKGDKARNKLGAMALLTAQGLPMIQEGQEFMKTKKGNDNSYDQDNDINWLDYGVKKTNEDVFQYYKGLIGLRMKYDNFKRVVALNNQTLEWMQPANGRALGMLLKGDTNFLVLMNSDANEWVKFNLPDGKDWIIVANGEKVDDSGLIGTAKGEYNVPPLTGVILKNKK
ncbi:MAG: alpha-amylase family glycosyl hydrolase [Candidatus Ozemobacteraceae bacterium]